MAERQAPKLTLEIHKENCDLLEKTAKEVRNLSHLRAIDSFKLFGATFDPTGLNYLLTGMIKVRSFNMTAFIDYVYFVGGGCIGYSKDGKCIIDPAKSRIKYDAKGMKFSIKGIYLTDEEKKGTEDEQTLAMAAHKEHHTECMKQIMPNAGKLKWWDFAPEKPGKGYLMSALYAALKKAKTEAASTAENKCIMTPAERKFINDLIATAQTSGFGDLVGVE